MKYINKSWKGSCVDFHGYDDRHYTAHVDRIKNGIATLTYFSRGEQVKAYLDARMWADRVNTGVQS